MSSRTSTAAGSIRFTKQKWTALTKIADLLVRLPPDLWALLLAEAVTMANAERNRRLEARPGGEQKTAA